MNVVYNIAVAKNGLGGLNTRNCYDVIIGK